MKGCLFHPLSSYVLPDLHTTKPAIHFVNPQLHQACLIQKRVFSHQESPVCRFKETLPFSIIERHPFLNSRKGHLPVFHMHPFLKTIKYRKGGCCSIRTVH